MPDTVEKSTASKVYWRLLPLAILTYFLCYLDRINVGFAALTMNKDLGLDAATYGMAAGAFFWGYFLFEVPSNLILEKVGARIWIARIMISWGILSGATAFVVGPWSFLTMRFLLGLAEAGLFPGMILFFTYWFPEWHRGRIMAGFTVALPLAVAAGAPLSTALLELNGVVGFGRLEMDVHLPKPSRPSSSAFSSCSSSPTGRTRPIGSRNRSAAGSSTRSRTSAS